MRARNSHPPTLPRGAESSVREHGEPHTLRAWDTRTPDHVGQKLGGSRPGRALPPFIPRTWVVRGMPWPVLLACSVGATAQPTDPSHCGPPAGSRRSGPSAPRPRWSSGDALSSRGAALTARPPAPRWPNPLPGRSSARAPSRVPLAKTSATRPAACAAVHAMASPSRRCSVDKRSDRTERFRLARSMSFHGCCPLRGIPTRPGTHSRERGIPYALREASFPIFGQSAARATCRPHRSVRVVRRRLPTRVRQQDCRARRVGARLPPWGS